LGTIVATDTEAHARPSTDVEDFIDDATVAQRQSGDEVIVPPAGSCGTAKDRVEKPAADPRVLDWFMVLKKCPK